MQDARRVLLILESFDLGEITKYNKSTENLSPIVSERGRRTYERSCSICFGW